MWMCRELVERVTDYLDGAMSPHDAVAFERHVIACMHCAAFVRQIRLVMAMLGRIRELR